MYHVSVGYRSSRHVVHIPQLGFLILLTAHIVLPFASPFAVGIYASTSTVPSTTWKNGLRSVLGSLPDRISSRRRGLGNWNALSPTSGSVRQSEQNSTMDDWKLGESNSNIFSKLLFGYVTSLVDLASKRELNESDVFQVPVSQTMGSAVPELTNVYQTFRNKVRLNHSPSKRRSKRSISPSESSTLCQALLWHQRHTLLVTGILRLVNTGIQAFPALLIARLLHLLETGKTISIHQSFLAAASLLLVLTSKMIIENQYFDRVVTCATQVRGSLAGMIFEKSLRLPSGALEGGGGSLGNSRGESSDPSSSSWSDGRVLNLMQSDTAVLESTAMQLHTLWDGPLQIIMYTSLLFKYLGPSVLWGIGVLLLVIPLNSLTLRILNRMRRSENEAKDARTKRTSEAISNMKLLKLQGWETNFAQDIQAHRSEELRRHSSRGVVRALNQAISNAVPAVVLVVTLMAYAKSGRPIIASKIFTAISLFNQLRFPLFFYPMLIDSLANGKNSLNRISSYLSLEENTPYVQMMRSTDNGGSISMKNGNFLWSSTHQLTDGIVRHASAPALCHVDVTVGPGEIVAVVGPVGSGKTALIKGLLGELSPVPRTVIDSSIGITADLSFADTTSIFEKTTVISQGNIAYCSQEAWLPKGTLKDAIVFGRDYDEVRYCNALRDAGLDEDFQGISNQKGIASRGSLTDTTDVGEGGSNLSGGQRARVALARALYADDETKVFLLDDPLAALDASVGATVFERLSKRLKSTNSAMVLVTNDPNIPRRCDRVFLMGKYNSAGVSCSTVLDVGTYDELIVKGHDLQSLGSVEGSTEEEITVTETDHRLVNSPIVETSYNIINNNTEITEIHFQGQNCTTLSHHADPDAVECMKGIENYIAEKSIPITPDIEVEDFRIIKIETTNIPTGNASVTGESKTISSVDEMMSKGSVPFSTYVTYFKCIQKPLLLVAMLLSYLLSNGAQFFQQYVVAKWTQLGNNDAMSAALGASYMSALVRAAGVVSLFLWLRSFLTMRIGIKASEFLHEKMLRSVFEAPMSFFDATPSGQLLSRFGKEMETIDYAIPDGIGSVLFCFLQIAMSAAALAGVITPTMIIPLSLIAVLYGNTMSRFRPAARDLKRSEASSRSPVYTHFGEALRGKEIIRSIKNSRSRWSSQHHELNDKNLAVYSSVKALDRWLSIRLETLGNFVVFISTTISILLSRAGKLNAGSAGWGLTQSLAITGLLTWAVRTLTDLETHMMSMMRVQELTNLQSPDMRVNLMPKEKGQPGDALHEAFKNPPNFSFAPKSDQNLVYSGWPWKGNIKFDRVSMRYNKISPLVLKNVSITISAGTTLGIVGRTGSGKSSLLLALFRLVELENGGSITIDDVDIRSVSLQTLRRSVSIIPQDPVLFSGTLRYNLDATGKASTRNMWAAIEAASPELAALFRSTPAGLDTFISEGGKNLSSGQRQLICLARALLRGNKILVMDEATSSVDSQTDAKVQQTIRREFVNKGVTVLTVAHRLDTILGYDKIAVFGAGELVEYGSPKELLLKRNGEFRRLVEQDKKNKRDGMRQIQGVTSDINLGNSVSRLEAA